ncbi:MAG: biopolymer transporter Tol, partial [candidate division Zixibacteria bacterium]|nr:biopolymer transporter Tol [candidate division Zixibacteria bacterium]
MKRITILLLLMITGLAWGQEEYFGQNKVQYKNLDWYYIQTRNFNIYFNHGQDSIANFAAKTLEDAYRIVSEQLDHKITQRIPVIIYSSPNDFQQTNVISDIMPEGVGGFTEVFKNRMVIPFTGSYEDFRHVLHHELTHAVMFNLLYGNDISSLLARQAIFSPPLWLAEGFAEYSSRK